MYGEKIELSDGTFFKSITLLSPEEAGFKGIHSKTPVFIGRESETDESGRPLVYRPGQIVYHGRLDLHPEGISCEWKPEEPKVGFEREFFLPGTNIDTWYAVIQPYEYRLRAPLRREILLYCDALFVKQILAFCFYSDCIKGVLNQGIACDYGDRVISVCDVDKHPEVVDRARYRFHNTSGLLQEILALPSSP